MRVLNANHREQKLMKGFPQTRCEPVTLVTAPGVEEPQVRDTSPIIQFPGNQEICNPFL
jgi:hypothetical protein